MSWWIILCPLLCAPVCARAQGEYDISVSEIDLFEALNPDFPGLEPTIRAWRAGDIQAAKAALANYLRTRTLRVWSFDPLQPRTDVPFADASLAATRDILARRGTFTDEWWLENGELNWLRNPNHGNMSRAYFLEAVGRAYWASGCDEEIAKLWVGLLRSWLRQVPQSGGSSDYWNTLVTGIRMRSSWPNAFFHFLRSPNFTDEDIILYLRSTIEQTRLLREKHRVTGNWLTFAMIGLYTSGVIFPELKEASDWREYALRTALADLERGYLPDGMGVELSPGYHNLFYNYLRMHDLALYSDRGDDPSVQALAKQCERLFEPYVALCAPDRTLPKYQDGALVNVPERLGDAVQRYPHRADFKWLASGGAEGAAPAFRSTMLPYAGYFAMRSGWERDANHLAFDAGPIGWKHCHEDKLNVVMWAYGRLVLFDPGRGNYDDTPLGNYCMDTFGHNTVIVDNRPQRRKWSTPDPSQMPYKPLSDVRWRTTPEADYAYGVFNADYGMPGPSKPYPYWEGSNFYEGWGKPAIHHRRIAFRLPDLFVVADTLVSRDGEAHEYDLRWQINSVQCRGVEGGQTVMTADADLPNLAVIPLETEGLEVATASAQMEPEILGWKFYEKPEPATTLRHIRSGDGTVQFVTLLLPLRAGQECGQVSAKRVDSETWRVMLPDGRDLRVHVPADVSRDLEIMLE